MLNTLLESRARRARRARGAAISVVAHATLIALAAAATGRAADRPRRPDADRVWYLPAPAPRPPEASSPAPRPSGRRPSPWAPPNADHRLPPIVPIDPIDIAVPTLDGVGALVDGDEFARGGLGAPGSTSDAPGEGTGGIGDAPATAETVERAVLPIPGTAAPRYPEGLRAAGIEGRVVARFVVDTTGRVEPGSVVIRDATAEPFAAAVRAAVPAMRFRPAEARGRRVRQLVEQAFEFRLGGR